MDKNVDLIVVGLGAMGSAAVYQAAKRGVRVMGIDQYAPPHTHGSTHAETRITRMSVGEGAEYVPFVRRSHEIWRELEERSGRKLFYQSGGYIIAPIQSGATFQRHIEGFVEESRRIAEAHGILHKMKTAHQIRHDHPQFLVREDEHAFFEPTAGLVMCNATVQTQIEQAEQLGATIRCNERMVSFARHEEGVEIVTDKGRYTAAHAIMTTGAWITASLPPEMRPHFDVYRQVVYWFAVDDRARLSANDCPFTIWIGDTAEQFISSFAIPDGGIPALKILTEQYVETTTPADVDRTITEAEIDAAYRLFATKIAGLRRNLVHAEVCLYTNTPDHHFVIDTHPDCDRILFMSACSGHGFKHSAALGEAAVQSVLTGKSHIDLSRFAYKKTMT